MAGRLTENAINFLDNGVGGKELVLQVMGTRQIQDRVLLHLSDGSFFQQAELVPWLYESVRKNPLVRGTIVKVLEYACTKTTIFVIAMEVVHATSEIIGDPREFGEFKARAPGGGQTLLQQLLLVPECLSYFRSRM